MSRLQKKHEAAWLSPWEKWKWEEHMTPTSTFPQYNTRESFLVQVLWEDWEPSAKTMASYWEVGVSKNALMVCCASTPEWCRISHIGIEPSNFSYAFEKSRIYAKKRVTADSLKHATAKVKAGLVFVVAMRKAMNQQVKNSTFWSCLRIAYKLHVVKRLLVFGDTGFAVLNIKVSCWFFCFDGEEDLLVVISICRAWGSLSNLVV